MIRRVVLALALLVALGCGWLWGAVGRWEADRALQAAVLQNDLIEARAAVMAAHVSLFDADVRQVTRHLDEARGFIGRAADRLGPAVRDAPERPDLSEFCSAIGAAQRLAERLDAGAIAGSAR